MATFADLELGMNRRPDGRYSVDLRFNQPDSDTDIRLMRDEAQPIELDPAQLLALSTDPIGYGRYVSQQFFADEALRRAFEQARTAAASLDAPLRVRLAISSNVAELHGIRWETLRDPADDTPLLTSEQLLFSRYLTSSDWRPVKLRPRGDLRALIAIANPQGLERFRMGAVDVAAEQSRALSGMSGVPSTVLATPGSANLDNILNQLRNGMDILYLVCHGSLVNGEPLLWLEDDKNQIVRVSGAELVTRLRELRQRPRLIVLASCQSAGTGAGQEALLAIGPRLAEAGIPAVLAMQGQISMETNAAFMPAFFRELMRDGQIDRAMAVARSEVSHRQDSWMPVLIMRLKSGRIWYVPGFADDKANFQKWPALVRGIKSGRCTPILGPGLIETILGSSREIAQRWADEYTFPLAPHEREDLPQVAQYIAVNQDDQFLRDELADSIRRELLRQNSTLIGPGKEKAPLNELITIVGKALRSSDEAEPHRVLANLKLPLYITTNSDTLLEDALRDVGGEPRTVLCPWNEYIEQSQAVYDEEPDPEHPLVYHLFGILDEPDSLVLTEDDYFNYLIGVTSNRELIPDAVRRALTDTAMLFLGFRVDDWIFRVLFRSFMRDQGGGRRRKYTHVAAQIDPEEGRTIEPERARSYLESYFQGEDISIYWGSSEDFIRDLASRL
ncbi:CHAT domain-containing protein [Candidatus Oscillochloris fontis]|uniref:CHAT domain-containing protein n=1 Tax=Candidatus Oscillochloris fontis TaxID=2496868 RepID=UPI00101C4EA7|nr:CHAT domain-containing protein [Candidatus Oscillochloris fontis]